jgi:hypothetical protein
MAKNNERLRGLYDLQVLLAVCEADGPAKEREIAKQTGFPMTSMALSFWAKRGYIDHDEDAHTWAINDAGRAYLLEVAQRETSKYSSWKESQG